MNTAKKRLAIIFSIALIPIFLVLLITTARYFNWYAIYSVPTTNMAPTIKKGEVIYGSSILHATKNNIVSYTADPSPLDTTKESYIALCRIVGEEGDEIEIKKGVLYLNKKLADDTFNLCYFFTIKTKDFNLTPSKYDLENRIFAVSDTEYVLNFSYTELKKCNIADKCSRRIDSAATLNAGIFGVKYAHKQWSNDNFGPVIIPKGQLFLLGDNRNNSVDSRIRGFIPVTRVISKIIK